MGYDVICWRFYAQAFVKQEIENLIILMSILVKIQSTFMLIILTFLIEQLFFKDLYHLIKAPKNR